MRKVELLHFRNSSDISLFIYKCSVVSVINILAKICDSTGGRYSPSLRLHTDPRNY